MLLVDKADLELALLRYFDVTSLFARGLAVARIVLASLEMSF